MPFMEQAATSAEKVDSVFLFILALSVAFLIFITFLLVFFVVKYRKSKSPKAQDIEGSTWLEVTWTLVPLVLFLAMFYYGWTNFEYLRDVPRDAMVVKVIGRQWSWQFEYPNGKKTEELYLAVDRPVRLEIRSADVIHGFYVPAFRVKMDAVPGKENYTWFQPTMLGSFDIECSVICGTSHTYMLSKAVVVPEDEFTAWYFGGEDARPPGGGVKTASAPPAGTGAAAPGSVGATRDSAGTVGAAQGAVGGNLPPGHPAVAILKDKLCLTCHSVDGSVTVGPTFKGVFGSKQVVKEQGREKEIVVDESYLVRSIQDPTIEIVKGYPENMPKLPLTDAEVRQVVDYIKSLD